MRIKKIIKIQGGIGNQLFQLTYCNKVNEKLSSLFLDISFYAGSFGKLPIRNLFICDYVNKPFKMLSDYPKLEKECLNIYNSPICKIKKKLYLLFYKSDDFILKVANNLEVYDGYWQYENYSKNDFKKICSNIKQTKIKKLIMNNNVADKYLFKILNSKNTVSIHIRRTDFLQGKNISIYNHLSIDYYLNAIFLMKSILKNIKLFIFSDDIQYAKKIFEKYIFYKDMIFVQTNNEVYDFYLQATCSHHINANSTFSFFSSILNYKESKIIIEPKKWFTKKSCFRHPFDSIKI